MFVRSVFIFLALLAIVLLQGIFGYYGGTDEIMKNGKEGVFSNGKTLHHVYTGYPIIDGVLPMSVGMWDPVLHQARPTTLLSRAFSASVQSLAVFAFVESQRRGCKNIVLRWAPLDVLSWQLLGAAIFIPLYLMLELEQFALYCSQQYGVLDPSMPLVRARALLPATILTVLHLYRMVYFPPAKITSSQHQAFMAVWQLAPFFCYAVMAVIVTFFSPVDPQKKKAESPKSRHADGPWVKAIFGLFGFFSATMHVAVIWELFVTTDSTVTHEAIFIPQLSKLGHPDTAASLFDEERRYFLQWDYVIIVVAAAIYVTVILNRIHGGYSTARQIAVFTVATLLSHLFSFGAVLAVVLYMRESYLRQQATPLEKKASSDTK